MLVSPIVLVHICIMTQFT